MFKSVFILALVANVFFLVSSADTCSGQNEVYDTCPPICPPQTCDAIGKIYHCPNIPANPTEVPGYCKPACRCISKYFRNQNNECVSVEECKNENSDSLSNE
ncbi:venom serine protease inhibitor-like [Galleria mellonella]|uniref:Venom serine protease inhibitor-like n=1 Tax=Galleria mellonella TaxID=7137 RepID=A0A6J1WCZ3_GALME|nr:venom serine protease inhibitor-like [Galleria mellonella]